MDIIRTKTLVKNAIVVIDAAPFRQWYVLKYYYNMHKNGPSHRARL